MSKSKQQLRCQLSRERKKIKLNAQTPPILLSSIMFTTPQSPTAPCSPVSASTPHPPVFSKGALLIGCEYTEYAKQGLLEQLPGCHQDVTNIHRLLIQQYHYKPKNIHVLCDLTTNNDSHNNDNNMVNSLLTLQPTRENIIVKLKELLNQYEHVTVYYSGHGTQQPDKNHDEMIDDLDECLVPCDFRTAGFLLDDDLKNITSRPLMAKNIFFLVDACHSATILDLPYVLDDTLSVKTIAGDSTIDPPLCTSLSPIQAPFICSLSGCRDDQTSASAILGNVWQGALSYTLQVVLEEYQKTGCHTPSSPSSPSLFTLLTMIRGHLNRSGFSQSPQLCCSRLIDTKTYIFSL